MDENTKKSFAKYGIDIEQVFEKLRTFDISLQCWQLDDVSGFEAKENFIRWNSSNRKLSW